MVAMSRGTVALITLAYTYVELCTMADFGNPCPKIPAWKLAHATAISIHLKNFKDFLKSLNYYEPLSQEFFETDWKCMLQLEWKIIL